MRNGADFRIVKPRDRCHLADYNTNLSTCNYILMYVRDSV